jgi:hypothetical protein
MRGLSVARFRSARTHACSVHTRVNASSPLHMRTGPGIFFSAVNHSRFHRVFLNIGANPLPFPFIAHPMVVGFPLPERLAGSSKYKVRGSGGKAFERLQQQARSHHRQQQHMHMVRHDGKRSKIILAQFGPFEQRSNHQFRDRWLFQKQGAGSGAIHILVHPNKCLSGGEFVRRRISPMGKAPMEVPGNKEPLIFRINMGQSAGRLHCSKSAPYPTKISPNSNPNRGARTPASSVHTHVNASSPFAPTPFISANHLANTSRSHECERGTHECVRHKRVRMAHSNWSERVS